MWAGKVAKDTFQMGLQNTLKMIKKAENQKYGGLFQDGSVDHRFS